MNDSELLKYVRKLLEEKSETLQGRTAWQEHLDRHTTVSAKSIQASEIIRGFSGSWASVYSAFPNDERLEKIADQRTPPNPSKEFSKIGQSGVPEINFSPYDHNTNRHGMKGTSLIGHPISFEVIGPTVKSSACDWQFIAIDNSGTATLGDTLQIDTESSLLSPVGNNPPSAADYIRCYQLDQIPNGGLYLVVSHTGEPPPSIDGVNACGLGDGFIAQEGVDPTIFPSKPRAALRAKGQYSKYEIFRVVDIEPDAVGGRLTLDASKRLKDYFNFDNSKSNIIRSITLIKPKVTRLVTIPNTGSENGRERAFVVVPPERSAVSDLTPPYDGQTAGDGTWRQGGFDPNDPTLMGVLGNYSDSINLPIPRVLGKHSATLERATLGLPRTANISKLFGSFSGELKPGQIIHIFKKEIEFAIDIPLTTDPFGWYEIVSLDSTIMQIKKLTEVNPETGVKNYQPIIVRDDLDPTFTNKTYTVHFHLFDPISDLYGNFFDIDALEHARLDNLIDPTWVQESGKNQETKQHTLYSKSDRSIFNTQSSNNGANLTNSNPGSLLDLGFRMVLFPAKTVATSSGVEIIPDFDHPINSRECILDTTISDQEQYIHIDYSNGLVLLSHEPKWRSGLTGLVSYFPTDINPNSVTDANGRLTLFASCVPYSREEGQLGPAIRVTASTVDFLNDLEEQSDIYGKRITFDIRAGQTVTSQQYNQQLVLSIEDTENLLPETGYIEILHDESTINFSNHPAFTVLDTDGITRRVATFIYHNKTVVTSGGNNFTALIGVVGGGASGTSITNTFDGEYKVVLRKNVRPMCDNQGVCGVPYQEDTTHGSAKRFGTIRFKNSDIVQNKDGSVTIDVGVTPPEITTEPHNHALSGKFVLLPKGPTSGNGQGESRHFWNSTSGHTITALGDYPNDTPLYEFSGGFGRGFLHKGYPIKPSGFFNTTDSFMIPPCLHNYYEDITYYTGTSFPRDEMPFNGLVNSGNLSVGYRHINSRESFLYSSANRKIIVNQSHHKVAYRNSAVRQMRILEGMVIEDVTNGTFYNVGSKGTMSLFGFLTPSNFKVYSASPISDGDTFYLANNSTTRVVFTFKAGANPSIPEEVQVGVSTIESISNLVLAVNKHPNSDTYSHTLNIERINGEDYLFCYLKVFPLGTGPTVIDPTYGSIYNHPTDFTGFNGVGGSIVGIAASTAPLIEVGISPVPLGTEKGDFTTGLVYSNYSPNYLISSGDRASVFWVFYDTSLSANINIKDELWIGFLDYDNGTSVLQIPFTTGPTLKDSLDLIVTAINNVPNANYISAGFPTHLEGNFIQARLCHIEENGAFNRYAIEFSCEKVGDDGNRFFIARPSQLGGIQGIPSLITSAFNEGTALNYAGSVWTTYGVPGADSPEFVTINGIDAVFFKGGIDCEINYNMNDSFNTTRLANQSGFGDRTDNNISRNPLAGHHYRVVPNVEFVRILGQKGVNGGLIPPYLDQNDLSTIISNAHALFYDTRYDFKGSDVGGKLYICGTDTYAYVGWWEILGIIPNYQVPSNPGLPKKVVAIVKKMGVETRAQSNDNLMFNLTIPTLRGALPLRHRSPIVRMGFDAMTNGQGGLFNHEPYGFFEYWDKASPTRVTYTDLAITVVLANEGIADKVQQFVVPKNDLATGTLEGQSAQPALRVSNAFELAHFCNGDPRTNGTNIVFGDGTTSIPFIKWVVEYDSNYESGNALYVTFNLGLLSSAQIQSLIAGSDGYLQVNFLSRTDYQFFKDDASYGPPVGINDPTAIGFISHIGHNSEFDTSFGDRNSSFSANPYIPTTSGVTPTKDLTKTVYSAANGLRWVISEPLEDRHNGSSVHMSVENEFIFSGYNWMHHFPKVVEGSEQSTIYYRDIFRVNKCPTTKQFVLGGDVEVFHTEVNGVNVDSYSTTEPLFRHPIAYSSLGVVGAWEDTITGAMPSNGSTNFVPDYQLQLMNKERVVTISPNNMSSNSLFGTATGITNSGTGGLGSRIISTVTPQMTLGAETPFKLFSKSNIQRSNVWGTIGIVGSPYTTQKDNTRSEREIWNSDNVFGSDINYYRKPLAIPFYYYSLYSWSPNTTWWQTQLPAILENDQIDASTPPPTLRVDLTEQFTQSLVEGNTNPKGVRLNKLWVNFGVWGDPTDISLYGNKLAVAGFPNSIASLSNAVSKPSPPANEMMTRNHISFNLVLELPNVQKNRVNRNKKRGILSIAYVVPQSGLGSTIFTLYDGSLSQPFTAVSSNDSSGNTTTLNDYDVIVGYYDPANSLVWTPFTPYKLARAIADCLNLVHKNPDLTPSAETAHIQAQAIYDKVYYESKGSTQFEISPAPSMGFSPNNQWYKPEAPTVDLVSSGNNSLLFGDRSSTATQTHLMDIDTINPVKTIIIPLYVNRGAGELMPNTMEQQVDIGVGKYNQYNANSIPADWNNGDPIYGFGYSDFANYTKLNSQAFASGVILSLYQEKATHSHWYSKNKLIGNPIVPVVWGGIDFDSANNNFIQKTNADYPTRLIISANSIHGDTYNGWSGGFTAPFTHTGNAGVQASQHPRLSRIGGGLREEFSTGQVVNGDLFSRTSNRYPFEGPASLNANAMTGIVVSHISPFPRASIQYEGTDLSTSPNIGTDPIRARNSLSCSHAFTIALTPVAQNFDVPRDTVGKRSSVGIGLDNKVNPLIEERLSDFGRYLDFSNSDTALVGNWLGEILNWAGVEDADGSSLPQGARVYLEIATNVGGVSGGQSNNGVWVGSVKCSFDVETDFGTTQNKLIEE